VSETERSNSQQASPLEEALRLLQQREEESEELEASVEAAVRKSEDLLREMSGLCDAPEPERQRRRPQDDCRGRLLQVDSLVQRRMEQLPAGDPELKMCRLIRSVCSADGQ